MSDFDRDAEIARLKDELEEEKSIVTRIWTLLGNPTYESLEGKTIVDVIRNIMIARDRAQADAEAARADNAALMKRLIANVPKMSPRISGLDRRSYCRYCGGDFNNREERFMHKDGCIITATHPGQLIQDRIAGLEAYARELERVGDRLADCLDKQTYINNTHEWRVARKAVKG
jgi:hypothetical protein